MSLEVCIFGSELVPATDGVYIGGSVTSAMRLARTLSENGLGVHVVTMAPRDWSVEQIRDYESPEWASVHIFDATAQHPGLRDGLNLLYSGTQTLREYCTANDVDIIHSHSGFSILAAISVGAGRLSGIPVVHTQYCPPPANPESIEEVLSSPLPARLTLNRTDHVFAMSDNIRRSLARAGVANASFLPPIVNTDRYHPDLPPPESISIDEDATTVLFVGNLKPDKGFEYLLEGAGKAKEDGMALQLVLTTERDFPGSEQRRRTLQRLVSQYELDDSVVELGIIDDMPNLIAHADVLVAPFTTTEGPSDYPLAILEAMACETPVVASDVGGIPELLDDGRGTLVPPEDAAAIRRALGTTRDWSANGTRTFIEDRFSPSAVARQTVEVYEQYV